MRRWWDFSVTFFKAPPAFSKKNSRHFRHDSMTITETLSQEAEQPGEWLVQSKEHLQRLTARQKWIINEHLRGNRHILYLDPTQTQTQEEKWLQKPILIVFFLYLYFARNEKFKDVRKLVLIQVCIGVYYTLYAITDSTWTSPFCANLWRYKEPESSKYKCFVK